MTWRAVLARAIRDYLINATIQAEAQDIVDNGFNADDIIVINAFLDSTYTP